MARLLPNQNDIAVSEAVASQEHIKPGDTMLLPTPISPVLFTVAVINVTAVRDEIARRFGNERKLFVLSAGEFKDEIRKIIDQGFAVNHVHWVSIFWAIVLSALLAALAGVYPAQRAAKTNSVEALAYE